MPMSDLIPDFTFFVDEYKYEEMAEALGGYQAALLQCLEDQSFDYLPRKIVRDFFFIHAGGKYPTMVIYVPTAEWSSALAGYSELATFIEEHPERDEMLKRTVQKVNWLRCHLNDDEV